MKSYSRDKTLPKHWWNNIKIKSDTYSFIHFTANKKLKKVQWEMKKFDKKFSLIPADSIEFVAFKVILN